MPNPTPDTIPQPFPNHTGPRRYQARINKNDQIKQKKLQYYLQQVTTIQVPYTLEELKNIKDEKALESICDQDLGPNVPSQCISAKFVDADSEPILFYFGQRVLSDDKNLKGVSFYIYIPI